MYRFDTANRPAGAIPAIVPSDAEIHWAQQRAHMMRAEAVSHSLFEAPWKTIRHWIKKSP